MIKLYRIILLIFVLIFLSTFHPNKLDLITKKNYQLFNIKNIEVKNNFIINSNEVKKNLRVLVEKNIFFIKKKDIEEALKNTYFLERFEVKKKYPDTIVVKIFETKPVAIFLKKNIKYIIDTSSNLIPITNNITTEELPSIFGEEAEFNFIDFFRQLKRNNFPTDNIEKYYYFQIGRWDVKFLNNKVFKFPKNNLEESIKKSIELIYREDFKNYNTIDLRIDGKIIVER